MIDSPCYKCESRTIGCHSNCEKYQEWRKFMDEANERRKTQEQLERWRKRK